MQSKKGDARNPRGYELPCKEIPRNLGTPQNIILEATLSSFYRAYDIKLNGDIHRGCVAYQFAAIA
jgi:hypothetical protein